MSERPPLPHAEEVRAARARVLACQDAQLLGQHLKTGFAALSILEMQLAAGTPLYGEMAGDDAVEMAMATYPSLAELPAMFPAEASDATRLQARKQQLELIRQTIQPTLDEREEAAQTLHELQHAQIHALEEPEWAEVVAELRVIGDVRDRSALALAPLRSESSALAPVLEMIQGFHPLLQEELITASRTDDPDGVLAWRVANLARNQLIGLAHVIEQLEVVVRYPFEPMVPDRPDPKHRRRLRREAGEVLAWMGRVSEHLGARAAVLQEQIDELQARHDEAEADLMRWMG